MTIEILGQNLVLLPEKAIYWKEKKTFLAADLHWGKAATMRNSAIPIPGGTTTDDLNRLTKVLLSSKAERFIILGDLFHAKDGKAPKTLQAIADWRNNFKSLEICLIKGNHDKHAGNPPLEWNIRCIESKMIESPFVYHHMPKTSDDGYVLSGHIHPGVRLKGPARTWERLACFYFGKDYAILPAFGSFTGKYEVKPVKGDQVFAVAGEKVVKVY